MKKRPFYRRAPFWMMVFLVVFLFPMIALLGPAKLRKKLIRQLTYKALAEKVTEGSVTDVEKAMKVFDYVHRHLYTPPNHRPAGKSVLQVLMRNVAWCDQQADIMAVLARRFHMKGGYVLLYGYDEVSHHTVCVLEIDGRYRMFDPMFGYVFLNGEGEIATLREIQEKNRSLHSDQFEAVLHFLGESAYDYFRLYESRYPWDMKIPRTPIWLKYMDYYYDLLGDPFLRMYQDLYFRAAGIDLFTRARLKHLTFRIESAIEDYSTVLHEGLTTPPPVLLMDYDQVTRDVVRSEAMFFRGQAYWDNRDYDECIRALKAYLSAYPQNRWKELACYYLGDSHEKRKEPDLAASYYGMIGKGKRMTRTPAPQRLKRWMDQAAQSGM